MRVLQIPLVVFILTVCDPLVIGQPARTQAKHARVELLATSTANETLLGVHFTLDRGWHIYWVNPGDSGQPPSFSWTLPAGATAGEIEWPSPQRLQDSPEIADYGYKDSALLMVPVQFPSSPKPGSSSAIGLDAKWLICREVCMPDHAQLKVSFPAPRNRRVRELFATTKNLVPKPWPKEWKVTAQSKKDDFLLTIITGRPLRTLEFFPLDPGQIENAARQQVQPTPTGATLSVKKSDLLLRPPSELRGVLVISGHSYQVRASMTTRVAIK